MDKFHELIIGLFKPKEFFLTFFSVLRNPREFILSINHASTETLFGASVFAALMSVLNLIIAMPMLLLIGVEPQSTFYIIIDTVITYAAWFILGSCFHFWAKVLYGKGLYSSSLSSYLYMTAFSPILIIVGYPFSFTTKKIIVKSGLFEFDSFFHNFKTMISAPVIISGFFSIIFLIYFFYRLYQVFRTVHSIGRIRGIILILLGVITQMIVEFFFIAPAQQIFMRAYLKQYLI